MFITLEYIKGNWKSLEKKRDPGIFLVALVYGQKCKTED